MKILAFTSSQASGDDRRGVRRHSGNNTFTWIEPRIIQAFNRVETHFVVWSIIESYRLRENSLKSGSAPAL